MKKKTKNTAWMKLMVLYDMEVIAQFPGTIFTKKQKVRYNDMG